MDEVIFGSEASYQENPEQAVHPAPENQESLAPDNALVVLSQAIGGVSGIYKQVWILAFHIFSIGARWRRFDCQDRGLYFASRESDGSAVISMNETTYNLSDYIQPEPLRKMVGRSLVEDIRSGDVTTAASLGKQGSIRTARAILRAKSDGVLAGTELFRLAFELQDEKSQCRFALSDGSALTADIRLATVNGSLAGLLSAERVALNFLGHLSGIASHTAAFVEKVKHTSCVILDTRKTTPLWRALEKYAVRCGGGQNHRAGLYDMILIKDNHIAAAGSITRAIENVRAYFASKSDHDSLLANMEVEVTSTSELSEALGLGVTRLLLDNQSPAALTELVQLARKINPAAKLEASGNVTLENVADYAASGVDYVSIGSLTHSAPIADFSLLIEKL